MTPRVMLLCLYVMLRAQVTIRCTVSDPGDFDTNRISRKIDGVHHVIALNNVIKEPFSADARYTRTTDAASQAVAEIVITGTLLARLDHR